MRVLVTGASGAIGTALRARLAHRPEVTVTYAVGRNVRQASDVSLDIGDPAALTRLLEDVSPDTVVHLGGISGPACDIDSARTDAVNVGSVRTIMRAAQDADLSRVIFSSSSSVYGDSYSSPRSEADSFDPRSRYADSKIEGEDVLRAGARAGITAVALRTFNMYGPGCVNSLVNRLREATAAQPVELHGLDKFVRDYVHVDDVVTAIVASLSASFDEAFTAVNVGTGVATSNGELIARLQLDGDVHFRLAADVASYSCADISRFQRLFGFAPEGLVR